MAMKELWNKRLRQYLQILGKYGRLIMNDHFSIILVIIIAFGALYYRELLVQIQTMDFNIVRWPIILAVILWLATAFQYGRPLWLTNDPDKSYLFARGEEWNDYWLKGTLASALLPSIVIGLATVMIMPFLELVTAWSLSQVWLLMLGMIGFKIASLLLSYLNIYELGLQQRGIASQKIQQTLLLSIVLLASFLLPSPYNILVMGLALLAVYAYILKGLSERAKRWVALDYVVEEETLREATLFKWIAVFADVPHLKPSVKRRPFLDRFLTKAKAFNRDRYSFLFIRALFRNNAYSGVWFRVMLFVSVLILFTDSFLLVFGMGVMGHLLTIVQIIPLVQSYQKHPFQQLYPQRVQSPLKAFQQTWLLIVSLQSVVYALMAAIALPLNFDLVLVIAGWLIAGVLLAYLYVPWWYKKQRKK